MADSTKPVSEGRIGQKYAFATASLVLGITCFVNILGIEKAILAIIFGYLALQPPSTPNQPRQNWAKAGIVMGGLSIVMLIATLAIYNKELIRLLKYLQKFN